MPGEAAAVCAQTAWENKDVTHSNTLTPATALLTHDPLERRIF
jgi:hypothetical protein